MLKANATSQDDAITPVVSDRSQGRTTAESSIAPLSPVDEKSVISSAQMASSVEINPADPLSFGRHRRDNVTQRQMKIDHPQGNKKKLKKFYTRQNELIDEFLGAGDEERLAVEDDIKMGPKIKFAVYASFSVNFCLFVIQMYAAVSTGSLSVRPRTILPQFVNLKLTRIDSCLQLQQMPLSVRVHLIFYFRD